MTAFIEVNNLTGTEKRPQINKKLIIFSDLDGTLLDADYSFAEAVPALSVIRARDVPLVLCSSKTRAEMAHCRRKLKNTHPFIVENGGGIFIPVNYFSFVVRGTGFRVQHKDDCSVIKLGADYKTLRAAIVALRNEGFHLRGFEDMSVREVSALTGLKPADAARAKERFFDEPFVFSGTGPELAMMKKSIRAKGLNFTQGEFFHIMGDSDKGRAVDIVKTLYTQQRGEIVTAALGDSVNDIEMLERADYPVVIKKPDGSYNPDVVKRVKGCIKSGGIGPAGWNRAVLKLLRQFGMV